MCLIQTGVVIARKGDAAIIRTDGREKLVTSLLVPDLQVGDVVLVGLGTVYGRATAEEAAELEELSATARGAVPSTIDFQRGT
jgi:hydrogenase maturation factor